MAFKIKTKGKIPLVLRRKDDIIYFQCQYEVQGLRKKDYMLCYCCDYHILGPGASAKEIGEKTAALLKKFRKYEDMSLLDFYLFKKMTVEEYKEVAHHEEFVEVFGELDTVQLLKEYQHISIHYDVASERYNIYISWFDKRTRFIEGCESTGRKGLLTFDTPLEFDDTIEAEQLGQLILEGFERWQQIVDKSAGNCFPVKEIVLLDETVIEVQMPRDKHFGDSEDMGVGELYQAYEYYPKEDAEPTAVFYLGIGYEVNCNLSKENIRFSWEKYYGVAEQLEIIEVTHGIFSLRAEMRNKGVHKVSYFMPQREDLILECAMEVKQPGKRRKTDESLSALFEEFSLRCRQK